MYVLLSVLATLLFALWYDYKVARVGVEQAYAAIGALNDSQNGADQQAVTTRKDVRQAVGRAPSRVFQEGYATVEEYGWPAGFPIEFRGLYSENPEVALRTHNYYAVYFGTRLSTHYKFYLPLNEIREFQKASSAAAKEDAGVADAAYYYEMAEAEAEMNRLAGEWAPPNIRRPGAFESPREPTERGEPRSEVESESDPLDEAERDAPDGELLAE
jgi:hypothetical protein